MYPEGSSREPAPAGEGRRPAAANMHVHVEGLRVPFVLAASALLVVTHCSVLCSCIDMCMYARDPCEHEREVLG